MILAQVAYTHTDGIAAVLVIALCGLLLLGGCRRG